MPPVHFDGLRDYIVNRTQSGFANLHLYDPTPTNVCAPLQPFNANNRRLIQIDRQLGVGVNIASSYSVGSTEPTEVVADFDAYYYNDRGRLVYGKRYYSSQLAYDPSGTRNGPGWYIRKYASNDSMYITCTKVLRSDGVSWRYGWEASPYFEKRRQISGGVFKCPLQLGSDPAYYLSNPLLSYTSDTTAKARCKSDGRTMSYVRQTSFANPMPSESTYLNLRTEQDLIMEVSTTGSGIGCSYDVVNNNHVFRWITSSSIATPSTADQRIVFFLLCGADYRTKYYAWSSYATNAWIEVDDVVIAAFTTGSGTAGTSIFQCNTRHQKTTTFDSAKWTNRTADVLDFLLAPDGFGDLDMCKEEDYSGEAIYGYINSPSVDIGGTLTASFGSGDGTVTMKLKTTNHWFPVAAAYRPDPYALHRSVLGTPGAKMYWKDWSYGWL